MTSPASPLAARVARAQPAVAALGLEERLHRAAEARQALAARGPELVGLAVAETRTPRRFAERELGSALDLLDALPELARAIRPRPVPSRGGRTELQFAPFGTVLGWHAANSPIWVPTVVAASALVAGNGVLARPSRRARRTCLAALAALAGPWPTDALLVADLPSDEAEPLLFDPAVHAVVAHASTATIKRHLGVLAVAYAAGARLRPYVPEGSGNDALVVLDGADPARAAEAVALGGFANAGQLCMAAKRIIVERRAWAALRPALVRAVGALRVGDPDDPATDVGPLPAPARAWARAALAEALARGGEAVVGAGERDGAFAPTVVLLPADALDVALWREESFAPLRGLTLAEDAADALRLANDTPFGLGAAVLGPDPGDILVGGLRAARVLHDAHPLIADPHLVVGGVGDSGYAGARPKLEQLVYARRVHRADQPRAGSASARVTLRMRQAGS